MTYDNFTIKSQEAILKAQQIAAGHSQQNVDTVHLIKGIMETDENTAQFLLKKAEVNIPTLDLELDKAINSLPKVEGSDKQFLTNDANKALSQAKKMLPEFGDEFISLELLLLGILKGKDHQRS